MNDESFDATAPAAAAAPPPDPDTRLAASRRRFEERLEEVRRAVRDTAGVQLERGAWTLPLVAAAVGFSLALWLGRPRRR